MNGKISPPQRPTTSPDVVQECEQAIDTWVSELIDEMITAGWPPKVTFQAIRRVIDRQAEAYLNDPDSADDPAEALPGRAFSRTQD
jgi:hypothetical protein